MNTIVKVILKNTVAIDDWMEEVNRNEMLGFYRNAVDNGTLDGCLSFNGVTLTACIPLTDVSAIVISRR